MAVVSDVIPLFVCSFVENLTSCRFLHCCTRMSVSPVSGRHCPPECQMEEDSLLPLCADEQRSLLHWRGRREYSLFAYHDLVQLYDGRMDGTPAHAQDKRGFCCRRCEPTRIRRPWIFEKRAKNMRIYPPTSTTPRPNRGPVCPT